jgi:GT2 family glycosyltransferase
MLLSKQSVIRARAASLGTLLTQSDDAEYIREFTNGPLKLRGFRRCIAVAQRERLASVLIILLSYNCKEDSLECLASIAKQTYPNLGLLVIDNASTDGAPGAISAAYPGVALISLAENRGWAGGNNLGVKIALENSFDFVLLLNNDTILNEDTVALLVQKASSLEPCLLHPAIYYHDPSEGAQLDPSIGHGAIAPSRDAPDVFELDFAYGACLLVHNELFKEVGFFDERFFLQLEETDFFLRAKKVGFHSFCFTGTRIYHKESRGFGDRRTPLKTYYMARNMLLIAEKHYRGPRAILSQFKEIYWSLAYLSLKGGVSMRAWNFLLWLISRDAFAAAARLGIRDYLLRRFGRISNSASQRLATDLG